MSTDNKKDIVIKKKRGLSSTAVITIVVVAVIVLACAAYICYLKGVFHVPEKDSMTMEDYSTIEVAASIIDIDEDDVESSINTWLTSHSETVEVTEGTVAEGDTIHISYVGTIDGVAFDGGSTDDAEITVGSSGYIDGFDDGLIGAEIGSTVSLDLQFPEDYSVNEDLAGQDCNFEVTILHGEETVLPELTDEFVKEHSAEYWGEQVDTVDDLRDYVQNYLYTNNLHSAMTEALQAKQTVKSRDEERMTLLKGYASDELTYYATYMGVDADTLASYYGYADADGYAQEEAETNNDMIMLLDHLANDLGLEFTDEQFDEAVETYMVENGYDEDYTVESFKEANGEAWVTLFRGIQFRYDTILEALEDRVVAVETTEEETTAAEDTTTAEADDAETTAAN